MNIAISGASGFIGKHLTEYLTERGHRIVPLGRPMFREGTSGHLIQALSHCDVVINLAGAPISKRWTPEYKKELYDSRIKVTHRIIRAMDAVKTKRFPGGTLLRLGERGSPLPFTDKAGYHPFWHSALTRWRGNGADVASASDNTGSRCDCSGHTAFSLDWNPGSLPCDGVHHQPRSIKRSVQSGGSATGFTICVYPGDGSALSCLDEGGDTTLVFSDAIW